MMQSVNIIFVLMSSEVSLPDDLDQHSLITTPVELTVENLLPGAQVQATIGHGHGDIPAHNHSLMMRIAVVLTSAVVQVAVDRGMGRQLLQPALVVLMQARFIVVDEHRGGDVHGVDQTKSFLDARFSNDLFDMVGDTDEIHALGDFEGEVFGG